MFLRKSNLVQTQWTRYTGQRHFSSSKEYLGSQSFLQLTKLSVQYSGHTNSSRTIQGPHKTHCCYYHSLLKLSLSANQLIYRIRKWLKLIGEKDHEFSLHSLCRGVATFAYQADLEGEMIKLLGGWASDCYKRYIDISLNKRYDSMKAFVEALNNFTTE